MSIDKQTLDRLAQTSYSAAAQFLAAAALELDQAAAAAEKGEINLAVGTALGAEGAISKATALMDAVRTIRSNT